MLCKVYRNRCRVGMTSVVGVPYVCEVDLATATGSLFL